ncbi:MAG TPA: HAMP domain-containing sensor histidine kinase [Myxococcota bacterium]|nr:HAMP domain-containing sensor histidine kinase [Myxococcota bacterium]
MPTDAHRPPRAPTALVLGIVAGALAALTVLPSIVPITWRVVEMENSADQATAQLAAVALDALHDGGLTPAAGLAERFTVDGLAILDASSAPLFSDGRVPLAELPSLCAEARAPSPHADESGNRWVTACVHHPDHVTAAVLRRGPESANRAGFMVLGLAVMVGISTALGVLQMLSPISALKAALIRVGAGERGVRVARSGLAELDDLVDRLNAATQAMEDREDAILARIELVQHLARVVAHEIRNPLQSLELLASLIASENDREEREELARSIQSEVRTLENVVVRLLRDGHGQAALRPNRTQTSLRDLVRNIATLRAPEARRRGVTIEVAAVPEATLLIDRALVARAIENLVTNSLEACPSQGGRVRLSAELTDAGAELMVEDNGPGVDPSLGNTIYQANATTKGQGHGLGLALVQGVAQAHDGYVVHDRSELGGARFRFCLPIGNDASKDVSRANPGG